LIEVIWVLGATQNKNDSDLKGGREDGEDSEAEYSMSCRDLVRTARAGSRRGEVSLGQVET
jgi:hypothetical protein